VNIKEIWVENHKTRLVASLILIFFIVIANVVILKLIYPNLYQGPGIIDPGQTPTGANQPVALTLPTQTELFSPTAGYSPFPLPAPSQTQVSSLPAPNQTKTPSPSPQIIPSRTQTALVTPTSLVSPAATCVHSVGYWVNNTAAWPEKVSIHDKTFTDAEMLTDLTAPVDDIRTYLTDQMLAAFFNDRSGASITGMDQTIVNAEIWLESHLAGGKTTGADQRSLNNLAILLSEYNNGQLGIPLCAGEPTSVPLNQMTPSILLPTVTLSPLIYPTSTLPPENSQPNNPPPATNTTVPTRAPTSPPPNTPVPPPTATPSIPLPTPAPTNAPAPTSAPAPTAAPGSQNFTRAD
jgi:hypothetical protein